MYVGIQLYSIVITHSVFNCLSTFDQGRVAVISSTAHLGQNILEISCTLASPGEREGGREGGREL